VGSSGIYAQYNIKEKIKIGYSNNYGLKKTHQIGFQYIFKKDENKNKLMSIPIKN